MKRALLILLVTVSPFSVIKELAATKFAARNHVSPLAGLTPKFSLNQKSKMELPTFNFLVPLIISGFCSGIFVILLVNFVALASIIH